MRALLPLLMLTACPKHPNVPPDPVPLDPEEPLPEPIPEPTPEPIPDPPIVT